MLDLKQLSCRFFKTRPAVGMVALEIEEDDANDLDVSLLGRGRKKQTVRIMTKRRESDRRTVVSRFV